MTNKDRDQLALRNRLMAEAFHKLSTRHQVRRVMLRAVAALPPLPNQVFRSQNVERILLIRPDHIGDVLLTMPAVHALRQARPDAELHALVGPWAADVVASYPDVELTLTLAFPGFRREPKAGWRAPYQFALVSARQLRIIGYSSAIIFRPDHWWGALLAQLAGIPQRAGCDLPDVAPFLTHKVPYQRDHAVQQNLRLVADWTGQVPAEQIVYRFPVDNVDRAYVDGYLEEWGISPKRTIICIHPGSGAPLKNWTDEKWAKTADALAGQYNATVVLTGGDHEMNLARSVAALMKERACIAVGDTRIRQLAALFARARLVLGPDSGPLHLAAAVGTPTVALFGPADPQEFGTWGDPRHHAVLTTPIACRPCRVLDWHGDSPDNHPCVRDITVGAVLEAAKRVID